MKCRQCCKEIGEIRYVLTILDDPSFCSEKCFRKYIKSHQKDVNDYISEIMVTKTRSSDEDEEEQNC